MANEINHTRWNSYKFKLQEMFKQEIILIRATKIKLL